MRRPPEFIGWILMALGGIGFVYALITIPDPGKREIISFEGLLLGGSLLLLWIGFVIFSDHHKPPMHM